jgi:hypothetical protein
MHWRTFLITAAVAAVPGVASAAVFFSFAPDFRSPVPVDVGAAVEQEFLPVNNHLSAVSVWLSNSNHAGDVRFTLRAQDGTTLATRTLAVPALADDAGTETSVVFPSQLSVSGDVPYRLRIEPLSAPLRVWRAGGGGLLAGSAGFPASKYGTAVIDGEPQPWSFAYTLHETAETDAPVLSPVSVSQMLIGQVGLVFTSNEPVQFSVTYGNRSFPWTSQPEFCVPANTPCTALLAVTPGVTYSYTLTVRDSWDNTTVATGSFTAAGAGPQSGGSPGASPSAPGSPSPTPVPDDGQAPVITNPRLVSLTPTTATFAWSTDEAATSWVVILVRPELIAYSGTLDNTLELEHYVVMSGLPSDQYLRARITSGDVFGHESVVAIDFQTPKETVLPSASPASSGIPGSSVTPTPEPSPSYSVVASPGSSPSGLPTASPQSSPSANPPPVVAFVDGSGGGTAAWTPTPACDDAYGYRVDVFGTEHQLIASLSIPCSAATVELPAGTPVGARVIVYAKHSGAFEKIAPDAVVAGPPPASLLKYPLLTVVAIMALLTMSGGYLRLRRMDRKVIPPPTSPDAPFMGAAARR